MNTSRNLAVDITDGTAGSAVATWGQYAIWDVVRHLGADAARYNVSVCLPVEPGLPLPRVLDGLRQLCLLHESLRTRLRPDGPERLTQIVDGTGNLVVEVRDRVAGDVADAGADLLQALSGRPFDVAAEWPMRIGLITVGGDVRSIVFALSHTATDAWGLLRLAVNLMSIVRGESITEIDARVPALQPRAEAEFQASDRGRRLDTRARRHWADRLRQGPAQLFAGAAGREPFPNAVFNSPALALAAEYVATHHRMPSSAVLLAAAGAMVSRLSGSPDAMFQLVVNNRFVPGLANAVSTLAQEGLCHLPNADASFADIIRRTHRNTLTAYRAAYYDRRSLTGDIARITAETGAVADHSCFFNDTRSLLLVPAERPPDEPLAKAAQRTTLRWPVEFEPRRDVTIALDLNDFHRSIELSMTADSALVPRADMERFLCGIEDLVIAEAVALGHE